MIIIVVFALAQLPASSRRSTALKIAFRWPGLDVVDPTGKPHSTTMYSLTGLVHRRHADADRRA